MSIIQLRESFTSKDIYILLTSFVCVFLTMFTFLFNNDAYIGNVQIMSHVFALVIYVLLGFNLSYVVYNLISKPNDLISFVVTMSNQNKIGKFVREIVLLNILALFNLTLLTVCNVVTTKLVQIGLLSLSLGIWPLIILFLLSLDGYLDQCLTKRSSRKESQHEHKGVYNAR